ncbi:MAG: D-sedoheptulose 7-phosphate isomerase [Deltaproteobacteria bacterium]|nr:D-sedoheptulose 7-phosphate isomerase [Deltaproteobacteria bacterium]
MRRFAARSADVSRAFFDACAPDVVRVADLVVASLTSGGKVLLFGNGGSAADAQHLAAELTGRYLRERAPIAAIALTTDTSALTAIANDYGFERVFERQLRALGRAGDVAVGISTSGNSPNVIAAFEAARDIDMKTIGLSGRGGGRMAALCDMCFVVPSDETPIIQQAHITLGHLICGLVEQAAVGAR